MGCKLIWDDISETFDTPQKITFTPAIPSREEFCKNKNNHLFIESDNYPALIKLSDTYKNSINLIYIDPPYNTGNYFTYNDSRFSKESEDYHSAWLSFMQRRLSLAKDLLTDNGCIFIAISQEELYVLKLLCDQIFGEANFVNDFMWLHGKGKKDRWSRTLQEHTLCYAKNKNKLNPFTEYQISDWADSNKDNDPRGNWFSGSISFSEERSNPKHKNYYEISSPSGIKWKRQWMVSKEKMEELLAEKKIYFGKEPDFDSVPRIKIFNGDKSEVIPKNIIDCVETTRAAQNHLDNLLGIKASFDNPKPVDLITHLIRITGLPENSLILDFFGGSGTTFEAVIKLNMEDNGNRQCIIVQQKEIPQMKNKNSPAGFNSISTLCKTRMEKVLVKYNSCQKIISVSFDQADQIHQ